MVMMRTGLQEKDYPSHYNSYAHNYNSCTHNYNSYTHNYNSCTHNYDNLAQRKWTTVCCTLVRQPSTEEMDNCLLAPRPMHQAEMWPRTNHGKVAERLRTSRHICYGIHKQPGAFCFCT